MAKQLMFDDEGRRKVLAGLQKLSATVKVTLGPSGRNVILDRTMGSPSATTDGVSIAKEIELEDPFENVGARLANSVADKTNDEVGDGSSTSVVLTEALYSEGLKNITAGANPSHLQSGMEKAVEAAVGAIRKMSRPVNGKDDWRQVAFIASHYDEDVAAMIADGMEKVGKEGVITVEESNGMETTIDFVDGLQFDKGYLSPYFVNNAETLSVEFNDPYVLLTDRKIGSVKDLVPVLELVVQTGRPLLIVAEEVESEALSALLVNRLRGVLKVVPVKAPAFGDRRKAMLEDMAILTGSKVISEETGLTFEGVKLAHLGGAKQVKVEKDKTTIIGGKGKKKDIDGRVMELRASIKKTTSDYDREKLEERLAKMTGGVAILSVGGTTEAEKKERKLRVQKAVASVRSAAETGVVAGAGLPYLRAARVVDNLELEGDEKTGARVLAAALLAPLWNIAENSGYDASLIVHEALEKDGNEGFDAAKGEWTDLVESGILDATGVSCTALQSATGVSAAMLTANTVIVDMKDEKSAVAGAVK